MKTSIKLLAMLALVSVISGCSSDSDQDLGANYRRNAKHTMHIRLGGDYVEESEEPLTKSLHNADGDTFYGVNVTRKGSGESSYSKYAYGVFTDPSRMNVTVYSGDEYEFEVTVLKNNTDLLQLNGSMISYPFKYGSNFNFDPKKLNDFQYTPEYNLIALNSGTALVTSERDDADGKAPAEYMYPRVHRYYGKKSKYSYSSETPEDINIDMTYECVGLKIMASSLPEGSILSWQQVATTTKTEQYFRFSSDARLVYDKSKDGTDGYTWEDVYSLNTFSSSDKTLTLRFTLTLDGITPVTFDKQVTLTRGHKKVLNVVIDGSVNSNAGSINITGLDQNLVTDEEEDIDISL